MRGGSGQPLYFYAITLDGTIEWYGNRTVPADSGQLPMRKAAVDLAGDEFTLVLTCD